MYIPIFLSVIYITACLMLIFSIIKNAKYKTSKRMSNDNFTILIPNIVLIIGIMCSTMSTIAMFCFTLLSNEIPHFIFYIVFGSMFWIGMYLIIKTLTFRVIVNHEKITVFSAFKKPYSFTFSEIVSVIRQTKNNQVKSERIIVKTVSNKKLIIENIEISYEQFVKTIKANVENEYLVNFESTKTVG